MSDYRNPNFDYSDPNDPLRHDTRFDPDLRSANAAWGWIAAAVFLVVVLAIAFGVGRQGQLGTNTASNDTAPPAMSRMNPPPATSNMTNPAPAMTPAPKAPEQQRNGQ